MGPEDAKRLFESLETVWATLDKASDWTATYSEDPDHPYEHGDPRGIDWDATQQEFLGLLTTLARGSRDEKVWELVSNWAKKRS